MASVPSTGGPTGPVPSLPPGLKKKKSDKPKVQWARKQVETIDRSRLQRAEGLFEYNIWYDKYNNQKSLPSEKATTRCNSRYDSGKTRADLSHPHAYLCINFARGNCMHGPDCLYYHRVPQPGDLKRIDLLHDVFGRKRHASDRDDMGGVGSFNRNTRTLYISNFFMPRRKANPDELVGPQYARAGAGPRDSVDIPRVRETLARHFGEWGEIEDISVKPKYGCAFIRFKHRCYAEFAKVAMADQSLDHDEQLNCRWAYDDPNPVAIERNAQENEEKAIKAILDSGVDTSAAFVAYSVPDSYQLPAPVVPDNLKPEHAKPPSDDAPASNKRQKTAGGTDAEHTSAIYEYAHAYEQGVEYYPNTDRQYQQPQSAPSSSAQWSVDPAQGWYDQTSGAFVYQQPQVAQAAATTGPAVGPSGPLTPAQAALQAKTDATKKAVDHMNSLLNAIDSGK